MFAHIRAEILFLAAGAILVVGVAYLFWLLFRNYVWPFTTRVGGLGMLG